MPPSSACKLRLCGCAPSWAPGHRVIPSVVSVHSVPAVCRILPQVPCYDMRARKVWPQTGFHQPQISPGAAGSR